MLQTAQLLPPPWLSTLGFDPARFQTEPPACYRASWQLPGPDSHRLATTSFPSGHDRWTSPPNALGARNFGLGCSRQSTTDLLDCFVITPAASASGVAKQGSVALQS